MPTFATTQPILAIIDLLAGDARIIASPREDTIVEVRPRDPAKEYDVKAAAQTRVEFIEGKLIIKAPRSLQAYFTSRAGTVDVTIELPTGSGVQAHTSYGDLRCEGELGDCSLKTSAGDISVHHTGAAQLKTLHGRLSADRLTGDAHVTGSGDLRIVEIMGQASIKNLDGACWIGDVSGDISLNSAHGNLHVERAQANVVARTAHGNVHIGELIRGSAVLQTASGKIEFGVREGTAAWLDVKSSSGRVRNHLEPTDHPDQASETVQVRARTWDGDITIRRATAG
jgi:DUF4097 and DUF4098 domain-containing protein YvlB